MRFENKKKKRKRKHTHTQQENYSIMLLILKVVSYASADQTPRGLTEQGKQIFLSRFCLLLVAFSVFFSLTRPLFLIYEGLASIHIIFL